ATREQPVQPSTPTDTAAASIRFAGLPMPRENSSASAPRNKSTRPRGSAAGAESDGGCAVVAGAVCALAAGAAKRTQPETITAPRRETICNGDTPRFPSCWRHLGMQIIQNQGTVMRPARNSFDLDADHPA